MGGRERARDTGEAVSGQEGVKDNYGWTPPSWAAGNELRLLNLFGTCGSAIGGGNKASHRGVHIDLFIGS